MNVVMSIVEAALLIRLLFVITMVICTVISCSNRYRRDNKISSSPAMVKHLGTQMLGIISEMEGVAY